MKDSLVEGNSPYTDYTPEDPLFFEYLRRNELGFMPLNNAGEILRVEPFGNSVIVYCSEKIFMLNAVTEPVTTYGLKILSNIGAVSRDAVFGNDTVHIFIDSDLNICSLTAEGIQRLGYKTIVEELNIDDITVSYDEINGYFYISDGSSTPAIVLSTHGVGRSDYSPLALTQLNSLPYGMYEYAPDVSSSYRDWETDRKSVV